MFIIAAYVGLQTHYLQINKGKASLNDVKANAVVYPSFQHAAADAMIYKDKFGVALNPVSRGRK